VQVAQQFVRGHWPHVEVVVPVPPSRARAHQPVLLLGEALAAALALPFRADCVRRVRDVPELKNVYDFAERSRLLTGLHEVDSAGVQRRTVLLFDDLFRSGATMNSVATALYHEGGVADVLALTITKTRSKR